MTRGAFGKSILLFNKKKVIPPTVTSAPISKRTIVGSVGGEVEDVDKVGGPGTGAGSVPPGCLECPVVGGGAGVSDRGEAKGRMAVADRGPEGDTSGVHNASPARELLFLREGMVPGVDRNVSHSSISHGTCTYSLHFRHLLRLFFYFLL